MKAPFPWFGGKRRVASDVWARFGDVSNYIEPFAGSLAVLLERPAWHTGHTETVNDKDMYIANFWRALQSAPDEVARYADWPVNECDLYSRHKWLVSEGQAAMVAGMEADPEWFDAKIAGWWVWGISAWIGGGWCATPRAVYRKLPHLGPGRGVHRKLPHLSKGMKGVHRTSIALGEYLDELAARLRHVRVCCGDWQRVVTKGALSEGQTVGLFLDPPYGDVGRDTNIYNHESLTVAQDVAAWCRENGDNPRLRIALCGYEGEHELPGWTYFEWKATGGSLYGNRSSSNTNRHRERIWFSPACLPAAQPALLVAGVAG